MFFIIEPKVVPSCLKMALKWFLDCPIWSSDAPMLRHGAFRNPSWGLPWCNIGPSWANMGHLGAAGHHLGHNFGQSKGTPMPEPLRQIHIWILQYLCWASFSQNGTPIPFWLKVKCKDLCSVWLARCESSDLSTISNIQTTLWSKMVMTLWSTDWKTDQGAGGRGEALRYIIYTCVCYRYIYYTCTGPV